MAARFKVDENLPDEIAELLRQHEHDAVTVADQGWEGMADGELWQGIQAEGRRLVTADKGFADVRRFPPGAHAGVILLRLVRQNRRGYALLMEKLLMRDELDGLAGAVIVVNEQGVRVRGAP